MKDIRIDQEKPVYERNIGHNVFNQLAVKVDMDNVSDADYFAWLDDMYAQAGSNVKGMRLLEKEGVRDKPPMNTAVYYDTADYRLLPTGALLRTSCSILTHAFCAFKMSEDDHGNRLDRRHVFEGEEKRTIQVGPYSDEAIAIVKRLLSRTDIDHPGVFLRDKYDITADDLSPAVVLRGHRSTFYVLIDDYDVLRCSIDRSTVFDYRRDRELQHSKSFREVEISIYPRIPAEISGDPRALESIKYLVGTLTERFDKKIIYDIKFQRAANALGIARSPQKLG